MNEEVGDGNRERASETPQGQAQTEAEARRSTTGPDLHTIIDPVLPRTSTTLGTSPHLTSHLRYSYLPHSSGARARARSSNSLAETMLGDRVSACPWRVD